VTWPGTEPHPKYHPPNFSFFAIFIILPQIGSPSSVVPTIVSIPAGIFIVNVLVNFTIFIVNVLLIDELR
jgi:hypothetical protein